MNTKQQRGVREPRDGPRQRVMRALLIVHLSGLLPGCSHAPTEIVVAGLGAMKDKALETVGVKKPEAPESAKPERNVHWRIQASESLNVDANGQSLALLTRIYKLRSPNAIMLVPYDVLGDAAKEKARLGDELIEVREVQLVPGQTIDVTDKTAREARYVAIVALYRQPADQRWRYVFSAEAAEKSGLSLGAHACALTVQVGEPIGIALSVARSADMACR